MPVGLSKFAGFAPDGTEANFPMPREGRHRRARRSALCKSGSYVDTGRRSAFGRSNNDPNMLTEYRERLH
jgi:hypothetical protein